MSGGYGDEYEHHKKEINCPHVKIAHSGRRGSKGNGETTMWFECKLLGKITGPKSCRKCEVER